MQDENYFADAMQRIARSPPFLVWLNLRPRFTTPPDGL
jgi:hypothetical protein